MTLRDLEIFIEVVKTKNMSKAAQNLEISQPTVSHAISQIENEYGIRVFDRISKKLYITDSGLMLHNKAVEILEKFEEIKFALQISAQSHDFTIGVTRSFGAKELMSIVDGFESIHPSLSIRTFIESSKELVNMISEGEIDFAIIEGDYDEKNLKSISLFEDEMGLVCSKNSSLANKDVIELGDLREQKFILDEMDQVMKQYLLAEFLKRKMPIDIKWISNNVEISKELLKNDLAVGIASMRFFEDDMTVFKRIKGVDIRRSYKIVYHREKYLSQGLRDLLQYIEEQCTN